MSTRKKTNTGLCFKRTTIAAALMTITSPFIAQQSMAQVALEEIVVTAQKRSQSIQDVGITINAQSEERIDKLDLGSDVLRLATVTPGLTAVNGSAGTPSYRIRGLGILEFNASFDGPVGVHVDESFLWKPILSALGFFDVNRVEVLKGPQGTVFGRNTTGGAVNFYSNTPEQEFGIGVKARYGRFERLDTEAYITGALSENVAGRLAVEVKEHGGGPFFNEFFQDEEGDLSQQRVRGILDWSNDSTLVRLTAEYGEKDGELGPYDNLFQDIPGGASAGGNTIVSENIRNPRGRFRVNQNFQQLTDIEESNIQLRIEHEMPFGTLTSITNYRDHIRRNTEDTDNTPDATFDINWQTGIEAFSQELRLSGNAFDGKLDFLIGGYYENDELQVAELFDTLGGPIGILIQAEYRVDDENWAVFTNNEYAINDDVSVVFGARYTEEDQDLFGERAIGQAGITRAQGVGEGGNIFPFFSQIRPQFRNVLETADTKNSGDTIKDTSFDVKLGLNYNLNDDALLFGSVSTGFRSGGFVFDPFNGLTPFDAEDITAIELGAKTTWADGRVTWNTSLFWSETDNYQDTAILPPATTPQRTNTGTLRSQGIETEVQWQVDDKWFVQLGGAYVDAEITESDFFFTPTIAAQGLTTVNTPEYEVSALVNYTTPVNANWEFDAVVNGNYQSSRFLEPDNSIDSEVSGFGTVDATLSLQSVDGKYTYSLWGKNLTDTNYLQYLNDIPGIATFLAVRADPITYGISVDVKF